MNSQQATINFTLRVPTLDFAVDVGLRRSGERWVARVVAREEERLGMAPSARQALAAALAPLGSSAVTVLLADLGLLEPSVRVAAAKRAIGG
jgi:hypothetical protein